MCTVLLPPGDNPIAVNKYIYIYFILLYVSSAWNILGCFSYKGNTVEGGAENSPYCWQSTVTKVP